MELTLDTREQELLHRAIGHYLAEVQAACAENATARPVLQLERAQLEELLERLNANRLATSGVG